MAKKKEEIQIAFSQIAFDQWRLTESGGKIVYDKKQKPVFQFPNKASYDKYLALNSKRK